MKVLTRSGCCLGLLLTAWPGRVLASPLGGIMTNNDDTSKTFVIAPRLPPQPLTNIILIIKYTEADDLLTVK